jgi:hypothetical protein
LNISFGVLIKRTTSRLNIERRGQLRKLRDFGELGVEATKTFLKRSSRP